MTKQQKKPQRRSVKNSSSKVAVHGASSKSTQKPNDVSRSKSGNKARTTNRKRRVWPRIVVSLTIAIVLVCVGLLCWDRWFRFNDAQDFQGQWTYINDGVEVAVAIDEDSIAFAEDINYLYVLDERAKKVTLSFSSLGSENIYRFTPDRNTLYIAEGANDDCLINVKMLLNLAEIDEGFDPEKTTILKRS